MILEKHSHSAFDWFSVINFLKTWENSSFLELITQKNENF